MATYVGFSTKDVYQPTTLVRTGAEGGTGTLVTPPKLGKKFKLVDEQLVARDLLNAFSIRQGDKVGQPGYGTSIWTYVYEPSDQQSHGEIEAEVRRVVGQDPRILLNTVGVYFQENGILLELEIAVQPFTNAVQLGLLLNKYNGSVQQIVQ